MRWLKELFNPKLKCLRLGHNTEKRNVTLIKRSPDWRETVADYKAEVETCARCGKTISVEIKEKIQGYNSATFSQSIWDEIDLIGYHINP